MGGNKLMNKKRILYGGNRSAGQKAGKNQNTFERIANGNYIIPPMPPIPPIPPMSGAPPGIPPPAAFSSGAS